MVKIKRSHNGWRRLSCNGYDIVNLIIFGDGEVKFESVQGWFETFEQYERKVGYMSHDIVEFNLPYDDIKRHQKQDLSRKYTHYVFSKNVLGEKGITLYINHNDIKVKHKQEVLAIKTNTNLNYLTVADLTFVCGCVVSTYNGLIETTEVRCHQRFYTRTDLTEFGKRLEKVHAELKELKINISAYELEKLLENYDLFRKSEV